MRNNLKENYKLLKEKYEKLEGKYTFLKKISLHRKNIKRGVLDNYFLVIVTLLSTVALILFKSQIAIEIGVVGVLGMLIHELTGTKKGWWDYPNYGGYKICGRVPIHLSLTYFFSTVLLVTYVMIRIGAV